MALMLELLSLGSCRAVLTSLRDRANCLTLP
jgi:hypothetical protein